MKKAFTLAEVLITLTIIGIVSAITVPSLMSSTNQKTLDAQRKAFQARLTNAVTSMDSLSGFGVYDDDKDNAAEAFVVNGLSKVYKLKQTCGANNIADCGIKDTYTTLFDSSLDMSKITANEILANSNKTPAAFITANGESVYVKYNRNCKADYGQEKVENHYEMRPIEAICAVFIYDLNGPKAPNKIGSDVGVATAFYRNEPTVAFPVASKESLLPQKYPIEETTGEHGAKTAAAACHELGEEYRVPDLEESVAMMFFPEAYFNSPNLRSIWASNVSLEEHDNNQETPLVSNNNVSNYFAKSVSFVYRSSSGTNNIVCVK